ncbi:MAG: hypothetical protein IPG53_09700 [Ignavibacteriales bacterium]|nr:hypothetical protein [Ignavibacteriales bacterium]
MSQKIYNTTLTSILLILLLTSISTAQYTLLFSKFKNHSIYTTASWDTTLYVAAGLSPELMVSRDGWQTMSYKPYDFQVGTVLQSIKKIQLTGPSTIFLKGQQNHYVSKDTGNTWSVLPGSIHPAWCFLPHGKGYTSHKERFISLLIRKHLE